MGTAQSFPVAAQSPGVYGSVIQHRMSGSVGSGSSAASTPNTVHNSLASPHTQQQRHGGPSPSSCAVSANNNFYLQGNGGATAVHPTASHTPTPTPTPSGTPTLQQMSAATGGGSAVGTPACSLSKLQQLTNDLDQPAIITGGSGASTLTPPPNHHPHITMTPPPPPPSMVAAAAAAAASSAHLSNRNLPTPPSVPGSLQSQMTAMQYQKYYSGSSGGGSGGGGSSSVTNMNVAPPIGSGGGGAVNNSRRNTASAPVQHMGGGGSSVANARGSPNMSTISPNMMYGSTLNGYRIPGAAGGTGASSVASYIQNSAAAAASFIQQPGSGSGGPHQLGAVQMMNMQSQYQDPAVLQRAAAAAQQNSMYSSYPYASIPLNGTMGRR